jgi:hypothetical protein
VITFGEPLVIPILDITNVACYRDGEFLGNINRKMPAGPWSVSKNIVDPMVYFERLEDAQAFVRQRLEQQDAGK